MAHEDEKDDKMIWLAEGAHSPLGPSAAERWLNCPASVRATRGIEEVVSPYAVEGTAAHLISQRCREHGLDAAKFLGYTVQVRCSDGEDHPAVVAQSMVDSVNSFIEYVSDLPGDPVYEAQVRYDKWVKGGFGTADDARLGDGLCYVTDFKHGEGVQVFAKDNPQLMCYALGILHDYGDLYNITDFQLAICQPRLDHIDEWRISVHDLIDWGLRVLQPGSWLTEANNAPFKAGRWCQFCRIKGTCRARAEWSLQQVTGSPNDFDDLTAAPVDPVIVNTLTPDDVSKILYNVDVIATWLKDVKAWAIRELQQGHAVADWKMVEGRSRRSWREQEPMALAGLLALEASGRHPSDFLEPIKLLSPPKVEKLLGKKEGKPIVAKYAIKTAGKPTLAPGDDKRPALTVDALKEFEDLGEQSFDD